jgi:transcription elongation factor Elf1
MEKEKNINEIVDKIKICENKGHEKGSLIKYSHGSGRYICKNCGAYYNDHLSQQEKNSIINYEPSFYKK